jgi:tRNA dimethylallyltransferase
LLASPEAFRDCYFLTGPTASGKTAVGLALAERIEGEILSMDSMAVYRGMDIGTAKPSAEEQSRVPHHLLDIVEPSVEFSIAQYLEAAGNAVRTIRSRGMRALFVGGTPLYLKALLRGMFSGPAADATVRGRLLERVRVEGAAALHAELARMDPAAAARLHPNDVRRVIRALEVFELTGCPISQHQRQFDQPATPRVVVLQWPRNKLYERIERRVDAMFAAGLVDEVRRLREQGPLGKTSLQAVGYREVLQHLAGERPLPETIGLVKTRTRQFAKRQMTWFRSLAECEFLAVDDPFEPQCIAQEVAARLRLTG